MYEKLTNLYPVSKTLRFELKPQGKTYENLIKNNVIEIDEKKDEDYKKMKKMMDEYHKKYIDECLKEFKINSINLDAYYSMVNGKEKDDKKFQAIKDLLRKEISNRFTKNIKYKKLFGKEMVTELLKEDKSNDTEIIKDFEKFTTYFSGYNQSRQNMYSSEDKSTAIAYRLIDENLPIFISNMKMYQYIEKVIPDTEIKTIYKDLEEIIQTNTIKEMFELDYYNDVLSQRGIEIYNQVIGGYTKVDGTKLKGLNEHINEYKQKHPEEKALNKLNVLKKQILSDRETASFVIDSIENDKQLIEMLEDLKNNLDETVFKCKDNLCKLIENIPKYDLSKIYVKNDLSLTEISNYLYDDWSMLGKNISDMYDVEFKITNKTSKKYEDNKKKYLKSRTNLSIEYINNCSMNNEKFTPIECYFSKHMIKNSNGNEENLFENMESNKVEVQNLIKNYKESDKLKSNSNKISIIKEYLDSLKAIQLFVKPLIGCRYDISMEKDGKFYDILFKLWDEMLDITNVYNKARNYLTGKPYSKDKIKLNFNNQTLLDGWAVNKEIDNSALLFRDKQNIFYLGIINKNYNREFKEFIEPIDENDILEKMIYVQAADPQKDVQNLMVIDGKTVKKNGRKDSNGENRILEELKSKYLPENINRIRLQKSYSTLSENFNKNDLNDFINYYKERTIEYYQEFDFIFKDSYEYNNFGEFTDNINQQAYQIRFKKISKTWINKLVEEGKLYLFKIYNKDFSENSHGNPNLHTLYWKMLFDETNLKNVVYKLNGQAEIFYRKASIPRKITHPKNQELNNKNKDNKRKTSIFEYDLIKDKRYTEDKFLFHVPITLNFKNVGVSNLNEIVNKGIKEKDNQYIIGIDRGERHLLYLSLINSKGEIVEQFSLNNITNIYNDNEYKTNYHELLDRREKERENARETWQDIENIKELKEGYLSQVINKITNLAIKYDAIIVLEDLNFGFMRGRQKFEKQVYQKFEKMLIDKLNYLVKKDRKINECGGLCKAYQLTNKFESFRKMGKQNGILYYIPAWNTSKMDPTTGFVNLFYIRYQNEEKAKEFIENIDDIRFNKEKNYFEFDINYDKYTEKAKDTRTKWTLCTYGNRIITFRNPNKNNQWDNEEVNLTDKFIELFKENNINYLGDNLKQEIINSTGKNFFETFINLFKLMLQMRNSITGTTKDYIISPVMNKDGEFYCSDNSNEKMPLDADANGAYNIARKGLWVVDKIKNTQEDQLRNIKLAITNKEWLQFIQNEEYKENK